MRKITTLAAGLLALCAGAVPASRATVAIPQPDGTEFALRLCGDEFYHFTTTDDGYTVLQRADGAWVYACRDGERLAATSVLAHDAGQRTAAELELLAATPQLITDRAAVAGARRTRAIAQPERLPQRATTVDVDKFRGLIILVQPSDVTFSTGDNVLHFYNTLVNRHDMTDVGFGNYGIWTGSVRDYYYDNSNGRFDPVFDVVGPVKVDYKSTQFSSSSTAAFRQALSRVDPQVNFANYDADNNGEVDMVFFLVAGNTAAWGNNVNYGYLWPHKGSGVGSGTYDGKRINTYACSTEMNGDVNNPFIDGIGTICHEFTHVLGFPDLYDTNYETDGLAHDPGEWDIMAAGVDLNYGRTPAGYSIFERYSFGFANPAVLRNEGSYTLGELAASNQGYILRTPQNKEFFIIENRQKTSKWDQYLPGHGMLVTRVDSTNAYYWVANQVNTNPSRMYYELLRAGNTTTGDLASDPFPGTYGVPMLTNETSPSLLTFAGRENPFMITDIAENNGTVTFNLRNAEAAQVIVETFNKIPVTTDVVTEAQGDIAIWRLAQCQAVAVDSRDRAVAMKNPSVLQMQAPVYYNVDMVTFEVNNTSSDAAKLSLYYSLNGGNTWTAAKHTTGVTSFTVPGLSALTTYWPVELTSAQPAQFRITMTGGSKTAPCHIDNFTITYNGEPGPGYETGDVNGDGAVDIDDVNILVNIILGNDNADNYDGRATVTGGTTVSVEDINAIVNILLK